MNIKLCNSLTKFWLIYELGLAGSLGCRFPGFWWFAFSWVLTLIQPELFLVHGSTPSDRRFGPGLKTWPKPYERSTNSSSNPNQTNFQVNFSYLVIHYLDLHIVYSLRSINIDFLEKNVCFKKMYCLCFLWKSCKLQKN